MRFDGSVVFVTGAGSGIGRATARRLAWEGAAVLCFDLQADGARETERLIAEEGGRALACEGDVRDRRSVGAAVEAGLARFEKVTHLVNNAGVVTLTGLGELTDDEWDFVVDVNLKGQFVTTQVVVVAEDARVLSPDGRLLGLGGDRADQGGRHSRESGTTAGVGGDALTSQVISPPRQGPALRGRTGQPLQHGAGHRRAHMATGPTGGGTSS